MRPSRPQTADLVPPFRSLPHPVGLAAQPGTHDLPTPALARDISNACPSGVSAVCLDMISNQCIVARATATSLVCIA